jgi:hypothetical protein
MGGKRPLTFERGSNRVFRAREDGEESIALRVDLAPGRVLERRAQKPLVFREHLAVLFAELLEQPR